MFIQDPAFIRTQTSETPAFIILEAGIYLRAGIYLKFYGMCCCFIARSSLFVVGLVFCVCVLLVVACLVVDNGAVDCIERLVPK